MSRLASLAAGSAALAIAAGAFGAHGAGSEQAAAWLRTGSAYLLPHAIAVALLAREHAKPAWGLLIGALIFALSLYAMALGGPRWLGAVTPIGGAAMIIGWAALAWQWWPRSKS